MKIVWSIWLISFTPEDWFWGRLNRWQTGLVWVKLSSNRLRPNNDQWDWSVNYLRKKWQTLRTTLSIREDIDIRSTRLPSNQMSRTADRHKGFVSYSDLRFEWTYTLFLIRKVRNTWNQISLAQIFAIVT